MATSTEHPTVPTPTGRLPALGALPERCLRLRELQQLVPYTKQHIYRLERSDPAFPRRIHLGPGRVVWRLSEVMTYVDAKARRRGSPAPTQPAPRG